MPSRNSASKSAPSAVPSPAVPDADPGNDSTPSQSVGAEPVASLAPHVDEESFIEIEQPAPFFGFVVAIGASAGGLDALERLFEALPCDTGAAFVVIQHLSPDHKSMMDNLLARYTDMPVRVAEQGMPLAPNHVFLIPPGKYMTLMGDRLQLAPKPDHGLSLPIDVFFHSLADQCHDNAIGVVLSGTGSDGARGLATLNANGGIVLVQDPTSAKFDGMPRSAIATGLVDVVAPVRELADRLQQHIKAPRGGVARLASIDHVGALSRPLDGILERLAASSGIDFREYKPATVMRRIERRMQVLHCGSLSDYLERLTLSSDEPSLLRRELLIPVTRFFRDTEVWDALNQDVITDLVERHQGPEPIRVWVACCATGEEAYTVAILFAEAFERAGRDHALKIFATDAEQQYVDQASAGLYPGTIAAEVSAQRLAKFFVKKDDVYTVRTEIRQSVIFARHNLIADPPFTRMDLVTCRNALIYFQAAAQERGLRRLQYALKPGRCLLLGPSESLGVLHRDFTTLDSKLKLYQLVYKERHASSLEAGGQRLRPARTPRRLAAAPGPAPRREIDQPVESGLTQLFQQYVPPTLLVGENRELLHVYGDTTGILQFNPGDASLDVLKLLPRELSWAAGVLLKDAHRDSGAHRSSDIRLPAGEAGSGAMPAVPARRVRMVARALAPAPRSTTDLSPLAPVPLQTLLTFELMPADAPDAITPEELASKIDQRDQIDALERELHASHISLQSTIEELETTNAELQATNEELMASNEELQSTNEELQSVNEELYTVNSEYQEKVDILNAVNADLENVSKAAAIPTVFVDDELRLTRFTPQAALLFKVRESDVGRSIEDFAHRLDYPSLFDDVRRALKAGVTTDCEVRSHDGNWWLASIHPYSDRSHSAPRAVMTFFDITSLKDSQRLQAVIDSLTEHLAVLDSQGTITYTNAAWRIFADSECGSSAQSGPGVNYLKVCADAALVDADAQRAYVGLKGVLDGTLPAFTLRYPCHSPTEEQWFLMHAAPMRHGAGGAVVSHINVTGWARERSATVAPAHDEAPA